MKFNMKDNNFIEDRFYREIIRKLPITTVDIVLFSKDLSKVLLFLRNNEPARGDYYSCGGRLYKNEDLKNCAKRKLFEETGIKCKTSDLIFVDFIDERFPNSYFDEKTPSHFLNFYFVLILDKEVNFNLDSQNLEGKWLDFEDPRINKYCIKKIKKCLEFLTTLKK